MSDTATTTPTTAEIRAWARDNGFEVGTRGSLPKAVVEAFNAR